MVYFTAYWGQPADTETPHATEAAAIAEAHACGVTNARVYRHCTDIGYHTPTCVCGYVDSFDRYRTDFLSLPALEV